MTIPPGASGSFDNGSMTVVVICGLLLAIGFVAFLVVHRYIRKFWGLLFGVPLIFGLIYYCLLTYST
jgi:hypothetical protein